MVSLCLCAFRTVACSTRHCSACALPPPPGAVATVTDTTDLAQATPSCFTEASTITGESDLPTQLFSLAHVVCSGAHERPLSLGVWPPSPASPPRPAGLGPPPSFTCGVTLSNQDQSLISDDLKAVDAEFSNLNYLYYPNQLGVNLITNGPGQGQTVASTFAICVDACPGATGETVYDATTGNEWNSVATTLFVSWCIETNSFDAVKASMEAQFAPVNKIAMTLEVR